MNGELTQVTIDVCCNGGGFDVTATYRNAPTRSTLAHHNGYRGGLTWDEMLGALASVTMPERRPCSRWLKPWPLLTEGDREVKAPNT